ncbi:MAG TPA: hypothetical protein DCK79_11950 [Candidatus Atribacteria bacterium]|jgi:glycosyltransferase involved in cell wall biosynthesis|nr:hypothetical protein [Candidatus Atribacteria bacterium]
MRILEIVASSQGGAAEHIFCIAKGIDRSKFDLTVVMPEDNGNVNFTDLRRLKIRVVSFNVFSRFSLKEFLNLRDFISRGNFDIVHFHGTRAALFGRLAAILIWQRPKILYTIHGFHVVHYRNLLKKLFLLLLERILNLFTDVIVCVSHSDRESVIKMGLARNDNVKIIWNGIDIERFRNISLDKNVKKNELRIPPNAFLLTMIGRLHPQKDYFTLISAFKLLQRELSNFYLLIVGDGPMREELKSYAKNLGLNDKIVFVGTRRDIPEILSITDIFILSTLWEGLPIVLLEAMAADKPVIASDVCGNREIVVDGETGILVSPRDPEMLAQAVTRLVKDRKMSKKMGQKGLIRVKNNFTLEEMVQKIENLYYELTR